MEKFFIPVAFYHGEPTLHTGPHGARYYSTEESAKKWRSQHGADHYWRILELTNLREGEQLSVRWCD